MTDNIIAWETMDACFIDLTDETLRERLHILLFPKGKKVICYEDRIEVFDKEKLTLTNYY